MKNLKTYFQNIHYSRIKPDFFTVFILSIAEFFYCAVIKFKNYLYKKNIIREKKADAYVICVGNLTTGGVGKTPIVTYLADFLSKDKRVAVISRGYGSKIKSKNPVVIKDYRGIKFSDGRLCADEPFQIANKTKDNVIVLTCPDRFLAANYAVREYKSEIIILDDGFSNRKLKKDKVILVIDSKMRFGNNHLLPFGPLREPISEVERADEIIVVDKNDENFSSALDFARNFKKPLKIARMTPKRIYNLETKADLTFVSNKKQKAIAFCAIAQSGQFFDFAKNYYDLVETISFCDHHKYTKNDIKNLIKIARSNDTCIFITTQKDETKLENILKNFTGYSFNVLELEIKVSD